MASRAGAARAGDRRGRGWRPAMLARCCAAACARRSWPRVGLAPLTLVFFQQVSLVGFVANLVAIPLVTLLITPLALLGIAAAAAVAGWRRWLVQGLTAAAGAAGQAGRWRVWTRGRRAAVGRRPAGCSAALLAVLPLPWRLRVLALPLLLPLLWPPVPRPAAGPLRAGRGRRRPGHGGAGAHARAPAGVRHRAARIRPRPTPAQRVLLPLLRARGETPHRPAGAEPPRQRPRRRRRVAAGRRCRWRAVSSSLAAGHALLQRGRARTGAATPASAGPGTACASRCCTRGRPTTTRPRKPNARQLRAARAGAARTQRAADRRHRGGAGSGAGRARGAALAQRRAAGAAPRQPHLVDGRPSSTPSRRASRWCRPAYRSRFGHPAPDVRGALRRARHRARAQRPLRRLDAGGRRRRRPCERQARRGVTGIIGRGRRRDAAAPSGAVARSLQARRPDRHCPGVLPVSIHVALNHVTHYRYDRPRATWRPRWCGCARRRIAARTISRYSLRVEPAEHFINWQQDPFANYLARLVFPEKTHRVQGHGRPGRRDGGLQPVRLLPGARGRELPVRLRAASWRRTGALPGRRAG